MIEFDDPWLSKSLQLTLYPTTGLRERLRSLYEECGMAIAPCSCHHPIQDHLYGKGRRVHNTVKNTGKLGGDIRCTVCARVHYKGGEIKPAKKAKG